jgi:hypothetical protein
MAAGGTNRIPVNSALGNHAPPAPFNRFVYAED